LELRKNYMFIVKNCLDKLKTHQFQQFFFPVRMSHVIIKSSLPMCFAHWSCCARYFVHSRPQCFHDFTINMPSPFHKIEHPFSKAAINMVGKVELPNSTQEFHLWIQPQVVWCFSNMIIELDWILAHDIIYDKAFSKSITVKFQSIANWIVYIHLSIIGLIEFFCWSDLIWSLLPLSLLQITNWSRDEASMSSTTAGNNPSCI